MKLTPSSCTALSAPCGPLWATWNSVREQWRWDHLRPGAEGPPPLPASFAAVPGCPDVACSLALSLSRLGRVAPRSTPICQSINWRPACAPGPI